ncbi:MAG: hypothetical protein Q7S62_01015 [bacterium]|nr:hypothetical protein [bacterium]
MAEPLPSKKPEVEETLQFLKREEVRTMAKDVALLREEESKKERERITQIKTEEPKKETETGMKIPQPQPIPPSLMPHAEVQKPVFVKAKTHSEKIVIRLIVIGVLLFILSNGLAFGYWYFTRKKMAEITPAPQQTPTTEPAPASPTEPATTSLDVGGEGVAPTPVLFFGAVQEKTIEVAVADNLLSLLSNTLKEEYLQGFTRIRLQNTEDKTFLTTREFLNKAAVALPEPLLALFKKDFMLFVYSSPGRKRLGFIGELYQIEGVQDILRTWETTLEQDTKQLWGIVGQKGSAYTPFFRQTVHQNSLVRFQTFSALDFGVVYTLFGTKLILATSFESLTKAVDLIIQSR